MSKKSHTLSDIINGTYTVKDETKYAAFSLGSAFVHAVFTLIFGVYHATPLFWYNMFITVFYFYLGLIRVRSRKFTGMFVITIVEILLHASVASVVVGWNWGFMFYTIALVPMAFYLTYTLPKFKNNLIFPIIWSIVVAVCNFGVRLLCEKITPLYQENYPDRVPSYLYYFNMLVTFAMLFVFSILFALEIRYMQGKLEQENRTLGEIALYDPLTHLLNRRSMDEYLMQVFSKSVQEGGDFCLIMADIDDFKKVNDSYGHDCGDLVLIKVAEIMTSCVRKNDYICRWGGEEILILIQSGVETAQKVAERICREVQGAEINFKNNKVQVTLTLGVSAFNGNSTIHSMISEADQKLYQGKKNGKNQVVV